MMCRNFGMKDLGTPKVSIHADRIKTKSNGNLFHGISKVLEGQTSWYTVVDVPRIEKGGLLLMNTCLMFHTLKTVFVCSMYAMLDNRLYIALQESSIYSCPTNKLLAMVDTITITCHLRCGIRDKVLCLLFLFLPIFTVVLMKRCPKATKSPSSMPLECVKDQ